MILAKAPLRVSFFGGGTDIPVHYMNYTGCTVSLAIDKYVYVAVMPTPHKHIKISYSKQELVYNVNDIQNDIVREVLKYFKVESNIEITSFADIPTIGSGLGGSSAFTCALVAAIARWKGFDYNEYDIAEIACIIEINKCGWNIGKQDQYASSFGGMNAIFYQPSGISVRKMNPNYIYNYMLLIPTNITRHASEVLDSIDFNSKVESLKEMANIARDAAVQDPSYNYYCEFLNRNWSLKKKLSNNISSPEIDALYKRCLDAEADAVKLLGAGGGGYLLAFSKEKAKLKKEFSDRICLDVKVSKEGAKVVYKN